MSLAEYQKRALLPTEHFLQFSPVGLCVRRDPRYLCKHWNWLCITHIYQIRFDPFLTSLFANDNFTIKLFILIIALAISKMLIYCISTFFWFVRPTHDPFHPKSGAGPIFWKSRSDPSRFLARMWNVHSSSSCPWLPYSSTVARHSSWPQWVDADGSQAI